jgi:uncharacterized phage-associated protein
MNYSTKAVANEFLRLAKEESIPLTPMKLQKLIYFAHGFSLSIFDEALVDEEFQAWKYGPVLKSLYRDFKIYGNSPIEDFAFEVEIKDNFDFNFTKPRIPEDACVKDLIRAVWDNYKNYSAVILSELTHKDGSPWKQTYREGVDNLAIKNSIIKNYFETLR